MSRPSKNRERYLARKAKKVKLPPPITEQKKDNMSKIHYIMVGGYFFAIIYILQFFDQIDLTFYGLLKLFAFIGAISFIIPINFYRKKLTMSVYEYILFNIIFMVPIFTAMVFSLNDLYKEPTYIETYKIESVERLDGKTIFNLENQQYAEKTYLRTIYDTDEFIKEGTDYYSIYFADGLFGIRLIGKKRLH